MYIPDMTERFPEGMRGVDLTDSYFPTGRGYEPTYEELVKDGEYEPVPFPRETPLTYQFEIGKVYVTHDWFTGATMKFQYEGKDKLNRGVFTVEDFEIDGNHIRTEAYDILEDNGNEYITIDEYNGHLHCVYARQ